MRRMVLDLETETGRASRGPHLARRFFMTAVCSSPSRPSKKERVRSPQYEAARSAGAWWPSMPRPGASFGSHYRARSS
jgi:hypothetical protein